MSIIFSGFRTNPYDHSNGINSQFGEWSLPSLVSIVEHDDSIEFVYVEQSNITYTHSIPQTDSRRVFKIVFSCKDGQWHKSERIYGKIEPSQEETYRF